MFLMLHTSQCFYFRCRLFSRSVRHFCVPALSTSPASGKSQRSNLACAIIRTSRREIPCPVRVISRNSNKSVFRIYFLLQSCKNNSPKIHFRNWIKEIMRSNPMCSDVLYKLLFSETCSHALFHFQFWARDIIPFWTASCVHTDQQ